MPCTTLPMACSSSSRGNGVASRSVLVDMTRCHSSGTVASRSPGSISSSDMRSSTAPPEGPGAGASSPAGSVSVGASSSESSAAAPAEGPAASASSAASPAGSASAGTSAASSSDLWETAAGTSSSGSDILKDGSTYFVTVIPTLFPLLYCACRHPKIDSAQHLAKRSPTQNGL